GDVADGVDVRHIGAHVVVDGDGAALGQLDAGVLQAVALHAGREADGLQHLVHGDGLDGAGLVVLDGDGDLGAVVVDGLHGRTGGDGDAELLVGLGDLLGDVGVLVGQRAVEEL